MDCERYSPGSYRPVTLIGVADKVGGRSWRIKLWPCLFTIHSMDWRGLVLYISSCTYTMGCEVYDWTLLFSFLFSFFFFISVFQRILEWESMHEWPEVTCIYTAYPNLFLFCDEYDWLIWYWLVAPFNIEHPALPLRLPSKPRPPRTKKVNQ